MRPGWTLHEMLISLVVMSGVVGLAAQLATGQLRFFRSSAELATLRKDASQASDIAASLLRGLAPGAGDIEVALDSAIEVAAPTGSAVVCSSADGVFTIPASSGPTGNTLAAFSELPEPGDRVFALSVDSIGEAWSAHVVAASAGINGMCAVAPSFAAARTIRIQDNAVLAPGSALRFARPFRLSLYRSSDGRWYLGARDWNAESQRFNTIQPVAGPLRPYDADATRSGLTFVYHDARGAELMPPVDRYRIAVITVVARASWQSVDDSSAVTVALRNAR
jgi:hypothetical protein